MPRASGCWTALWMPAATRAMRWPAQAARPARRLPGSAAPSLDEFEHTPAFDEREYRHRARGDVSARRRDACAFPGCRPGSRTPRRFRCQPDLAVDAAPSRTPWSATPRLTPAERTQIAQLCSGLPAAGILRGTVRPPGVCPAAFVEPAGDSDRAEDGSEMGAFSHVKQPQRESNLRIRLQEYLPFGLQAGIIYATYEDYTMAGDYTRNTYSPVQRFPRRADAAGPGHGGRGLQ